MGNPEARVSVVHIPTTKNVQGGLGLMTELQGRVAIVLLALILAVQVAAFVRSPSPAAGPDLTGVQQVEVVNDVKVNGTVQADLGHNSGVWTKPCAEAFPGSECP
jgi:hypothetical protein